MRKAQVIRMGVAGFSVTAFVLIYTYAQTIIRSNSSSHTKEEKEIVAEEIEDVGIPTGDDPWNEMDKLVAAYYNTGGISYKGLVKLIDDNGTKEKIMEVHPFECSFFKGGFQYSLDSMEIINQQEYVIAIDHRVKLVTYSKSGVEESSSKLFDIAEFRKIMQEQHANAVVTQLANEKILTIDSIQNPQIQGYRIYYDPKTYQISKMIVGMIRLSPLADGSAGNYITENSSDQDNKSSENIENEKENQDEIEFNTYTYFIEITYSQRHLISQNDQFGIVKKILNISKDTVELQPKYKNYQLLNLIE